MAKYYILGAIFLMLVGGYFFVTSSFFESLKVSVSDSNKEVTGVVTSVDRSELMLDGPTRIAI